MDAVVAGVGTGGMLTGISSGVAARLARLHEFAEKIIVVVLPDAGECYLSSILFEGVGG